VSFRKLATHPDLPMSAGALCRSLAMYELFERLGIVSWKHICTSHLRLVLPCSHEVQHSLLHAAEKDRWSVRQLDEQIHLLPSDRRLPNRGGPTRGSAILKRARALEKCVGELQTALNRTEAGDHHGSRTAIEILQRAALVCNELEQGLRRSLPCAQGGGEPPAAADQEADEQSIRPSLVPEHAHPSLQGRRARRDSMRASAANEVVRSEA
jgi:hypothetical protein